MRRRDARPLALALLAAAWVGLPGRLPAQSSSFRQPPADAASLPAGRTQGVMQMTAPPSQGYQPAPAPPPAAYPLYPQYNGPVGGALSGSADVINSQGQFAIAQQQAVLEREKIKSARIDNKQKAMEQFLWERQNMPTLQDDRERDQAQDLRRARTPPPTEIWSGKSLNDLLAGIQQTERQTGLRGPAVPLDDQLMRYINFTTGTPQGAPTMIQGGKLSWPSFLRRSQFDKERKQIDQLMADLTRQASSGQLDGGSLDSLVASTDRLRSQVRRNVAEAPPNDYIGAVRYLNQLQDTLKGLQGPNGASLLAGRSAVQAGTVGDLVEQMGQKGLRFGPAAAGYESAYNGLHQALLAYDSGLARMMTVARR
jgi:hypothetical protein